MKVLVPVKRVIDYNVRIHVKPDGSGVETAGVKHSINPFDEIAVEEAVRLKEKNIASEVIVVTIGPDNAQDVLRHALALGADRGLHITTEQHIEPLSAAKLLKSITEREVPQLIIMGKQAIDDDCNQTGQMLAALLGWGQGTFASKLVVENNIATVTREVDGGLITIALPLPAVITTDLRLNEPRYASMPNIMKARSKPIAKITLEELDINISPRLRTVSVAAPLKRKGGIKVKSVEELVEKLRSEAKVLA